VWLKKETLRLEKSELLGNIKNATKWFYSEGGAGISGRDGLAGTQRNINAECMIHREFGERSKRAGKRALHLRAPKRVSQQI